MIIVYRCVAALCFLAGAFFPAVAQGKSVLEVMPRNSTAASTDAELAIKGVAEECGKAVLTRDNERLQELSASEGFEHENVSALQYFMNHYQGSGSDALMFSATDIEVIAVRLLEGEKEALVSVRAVFSEVSEQYGVSSAPLIETWKFFKKDGKWLLSIRETQSGLTRFPVNSIASKKK